MTNDKKKIYWHLNWILAAVVALILGAVFAYRYFAVGYPVEANWGEEIGKYFFMWPVLSVICGTIAWVPFKALSSYIAKKRGNTDDEPVEPAKEEEKSDEKHQTLI